MRSNLKLFSYKHKELTIICQNSISYFQSQTALFPNPPSVNIVVVQTKITVIIQLFVIPKR